MIRTKFGDIGVISADCMPEGTLVIMNKPPVAPECEELPLEGLASRDEYLDRIACKIRWNQYRSEVERWEKNIHMITNVGTPEDGVLGEESRQESPDASNT
jgi:hypothetical protein